jgi:hypothetical protein
MIYEALHKKIVWPTRTPLKPVNEFRCCGLCIEILLQRQINFYFQFALKGYYRNKLVFTFTLHWNVITETHLGDNYSVLEQMEFTITALLGTMSFNQNVISSLKYISLTGQL